jgi:branched-chain amino acid transport system ATP-binding protein
LVHSPLLDLSKEFYLGLTELGHRKSYRDVKHYKRRKRWLS